MFSGFKSFSKYSSEKSFWLFFPEGIWLTHYWLDIIVEQGMENSTSVQHVAAFCKYAYKNEQTLLI